MGKEIVKMRISQIVAPDLETAWKRARRESRTTNYTVTRVKYNHKFKSRSGSVYTVYERKRR